MSIRLAGIFKSPYSRPCSLCIVLILLLCLPPQIVSADIGPKPTASFGFVWKTDEQTTIVEGLLLQCKDSECAESHPLEALGPQRFTCGDTACDSMAYGYTQYAKLVITFSDGVTRESNIFEKNYDDSTFEVTVQSSDLIVIETRGTYQPFQTRAPFSTLVRWLGIVLGLIALAVLLIISTFFIVKTRQASLIFTNAKITCISVWVITFPALILGAIFAPTMPLTIVIEGVLISLYTLIKKHRWFPWLTVVTLGNLFTQVLLLTVLSVVGAQGQPFVIMIPLEIVIWLFEALLIHLTLRRQSSIAASLGISLMINVVSLGIGLLLPV